jgi:hypothetical protein
MRRVPQNLPIGHLHQRDRHGGREEHGLPLLWQPREDPSQVGDEAHVHHPVGLVQHEDLDAVEPSQTSLAVVEQAPRRGHHDFIAGLEGLLLAGHADTAVHVYGAQVRAAGEPRTLFRGLGRDLTSGREDQRSRPAVAAAVETLNQWQQEGGGLAAPRLRRGDDIAAGKRKGDYFLLDGRRCVEAHLISGPKKLGGETEVTEDWRFLAS